MFRFAKGKELVWETSSACKDKRESDDGQSYSRNHSSKVVMKKG